jgi:hypothetical protein
VGSERIAVIVPTGERPVTADLLRAASNLLISFREWREVETHFGIGCTGKFSYWVHFDWLERDDGSKPIPAEYRPCPQCAGTGTEPDRESVACHVCLGRPWRDVWEFEVGYPVTWIRTAFESGQIERRPHYLICPAGRLHPWTWFEVALREFDGCWLVPMLAGLS